MRKLIGRTITWKSSICGCHALKEVDTENQIMQIFPCSYDHFVWTWRVAEYSTNQQLREMPKVRRFDIDRMNKFLLWKHEDSVFMRPNYIYENNGLTAYQCFVDWDGKGISLPKSLEEPDLLSDLVQGKTCREFQIDQWVETYKLKDEYIIWPEEYISHPGMNEQLFETLFRRKPNKDILEVLKGKKL